MITLNLSCLAERKTSHSCWCTHLILKYRWKAVLTLEEVAYLFFWISSCYIVTKLNVITYENSLTICTLMRRPQREKSFLLILLWFNWDGSIKIVARWNKGLFRHCLHFNTRRPPPHSLAKVAERRAAENQP